jgi:phosphate/sulfate permease
MVELIDASRSSAFLLLAARKSIRDPEPYVPPPADPDARPPWWIRGILLTTCGGVSLAHGSNDGQKGMGLIMLVLIGLLPASFALNLKDASGARETRAAASDLRLRLASYQTPGAGQAVRELDALIDELDGKDSLREVPLADRWHIRAEIFHVDRLLGGHREPGARPELDKELDRPRRALRHAIEYVPTWVVVGVALCLGIGTTIGYERIVITVAEKIGKTHLTYAQGASAEIVAMTTIAAADLGGLPVSTTHVLSSGVAGTMWANNSGIQPATIRNIALAWILTLPASMLIAAGLFLFGNLALGT